GKDSKNPEASLREKLKEKRLYYKTEVAKLVEKKKDKKNIVINVNGQNINSDDETISQYALKAAIYGYSDILIEQQLTETHFPTKSYEYNSSHFPRVLCDGYHLTFASKSGMTSEKRVVKLEEEKEGKHSNPGNTPQGKDKGKDGDDTKDGAPDPTPK